MKENVLRPKWNRVDLLAMATWVLGIGVRVWTAWAGRCLSEPDPGVVGLMARHMAEWKEFPVFFYGQAYMGSLEPMASALMVRLLGSTGFAVGLGTTLFAALALFFLWRWARDAAGPWGGLAAMLAGLLGPLGYFHFQSLPRGGYMVALAVDAWVLWAAARMAARLREGNRVGGFRYLFLGLVAGVGMWSNMIIVSALATAALLLAHGMRWKIWKHLAGITSGLAGFLAGFSPWLVYNIRHGWESLEMSQIGGHDPVFKSLQNSWTRFLMLQDAGQLPAGSPLLYVLALAVLGLAAWGAVVVVMQFRRASHRENYSRVAALVFCMVFACVFATSGFTRTRTGRYWIPLVPGLAVLSAVACAAPGGRVRRGLAWGGLVALTVAQGFLCFSGIHTLASRSSKGLAAYREIGEALERANVDVLLAPLQLFAMNFALDERVAISNGKQRFYEPILRRAELSDSPAYSAEYFGIESFLLQRGAEWDSVVAGGHRIVWNVRCSPVALQDIDVEHTSSLRDEAGAEWKNVLMDRNIDTYWSPGAETGGAANSMLEWGFAEPQDVQAVQLVFFHGLTDEGFDFPRQVQVEAKVAGQWRTVYEKQPVIPLEWSGPRAYYPSGLARLELPVKAKAVEALRIGLLDTQARIRTMGWRLSELIAFTKQDEPLPKVDAVTLDALCERVSEAYPEPVIYAPRWVSNKLHQRGCVRDSRLAGLSGRVFDPEPGNPRDGTLPCGRPCLFIVEFPQARITRETLAVQGIPFQESSEGPWSLFAVDAKGFGMDMLALPPALLWTGESLLAGNTAARAARSLHLLRAADIPEDTKKTLVQDLVRWRPAALSGLTEEETRRWGGEEAVKSRREAALVPENPCATQFANGIRLEGVDLASSTVPAGGELVLRLYWSAGEGIEAENEIVFIHLRDGRGNIVAQGDYWGTLLLWGVPSVQPASGECVVETRRMALPAGLPPGPLDLSIGLYQMGTGRRTRVLQSEAPEVRRNAATWPARIQVVE